MVGVWQIKVWKLPEDNTQGRLPTTQWNQPGTKTHTSKSFIQHTKKIKGGKSLSVPHNSNPMCYYLDGGAWDITRQIPTGPVVGGSWPLPGRVGGEYVQNYLTNTFYFAARLFRFAWLTCKISPQVQYLINIAWWESHQQPNLVLFLISHRFIHEFCYAYVFAYCELGYIHHR